MAALVRESAKFWLRVMNELKTRGVTTSRSAQIEYLMSTNVAFGYQHISCLAPCLSHGRVRKRP